ALDAEQPYRMKEDHDHPPMRRAAERLRENVVADQERGLHARVGDLIRLDEVVKKPHVSRLDERGDNQKQRRVDVPAVVASEDIVGSGAPSLENRIPSNERGKQDCNDDLAQEDEREREARRGQGCQRGYRQGSYQETKQIDEEGRPWSAGVEMAQAGE